MPPFGANELLSEAEVTHVVAYLLTLKHSVAAPQHPCARGQRERVYVAGEDFSAADEYIDAGSAAFSQAGRNGRSCASCHAPQAKESVDLRGAARRYPRFDENLGRVVGLEEQVNYCRERRMASDPIPLDSRTMNLLAGYVKFLDRGNAINIDSGAAGAEAFERGRTSFERKVGQLNFSCADCHEFSGSEWLRAQRLQKNRKRSIDHSSPENPNACVDSPFCF